MKKKLFLSFYGFAMAGALLLASCEDNPIFPNSDGTTEDPVWNDGGSGNDGTADNGMGEDSIYVDPNDGCDCGYGDDDFPNDDWGNDDSTYYDDPYGNDPYDDSIYYDDPYGNDPYDDSIYYGDPNGGNGGCDSTGFGG